MAPPPFAVQPTRLHRLFEGLYPRRAAATYLAPWISDYSLLRFSFPHAPVVLRLNQLPESRYPESDNVGPLTGPDQWWTARDRHVGSHSELVRRPRPWIYLGWTDNPPSSDSKGH
jgi:hypothetical protein